MSQLNQQLSQQLDKIQKEYNELATTEKKIGEIINWCSSSYQNTDKEQTFTKTKEYLQAVLNVSKIKIIISNNNNNNNNNFFFYIKNN
jgi:endonuclease IV